MTGISPRNAAEQSTLEVLGAQLALNDYSRAVDGVTAALSYVQAYEPPAELPDGYVSIEEFERRTEILLALVRSWR